MDELEVLRDAVGERRVDQEGFPYPWLSKEYRQGLPRFQALPERLHSRRMAPTRKKPGGMRHRRERIVLQGIKIEHHGHAAAFSSWGAGLTGASSPRSSNSPFAGSGAMARYDPQACGASRQACRSRPCV